MLPFPSHAQLLKLYFFLLLLRPLFRVLGLCNLPSPLMLPAYSVAFSSVLGCARPERGHHSPDQDVFVIALNESWLTTSGLISARQTTRRFCWHFTYFTLYERHGIFVDRRVLEPASANTLPHLLSSHSLIVMQ